MSRRRLVKDELLGLVGQLERHLEHMSQSLRLSASGMEFMNVEEAQEQLRLMDGQQAEVLEMRQEALRSLRLQLAIQDMRQRLAEAENAVTDFAKATAHAKNLIQVARHEVDPILKAEQDAKNEIDLNECLAFAKRISITSTAPPRWEEGQPLGIFLPPCPGEDQMATSILYRDMEELVKEQLAHKRQKTAGDGTGDAAGAAAPPPAGQSGGPSSSATGKGGAPVNTSAGAAGGSKPAISFSLYDSDSDSSSDSSASDYD